MILCPPVSGVFRVRNHVTVCSGRKSKATRCIKYAKELKGVKQVYGALYALGTTYQQVRLQVFEHILFTQ